MNQDQLVSVIVPIYKVELYLPRCIESIINQTYTNLEILLVDDGSPDRCGKICDEYARQDLRIKTFHKENGGLSDARNYALDRMTGEYVTFIDSDDYVDLRYIEILVKLLKNSNDNISMVGCQTFEDDARILRYAGQPFKVVSYTKEEVLQRALKVQLRQSAWGKLYKSEVFRNIRFPKGKIYEDLAVFYDVIENSNGIIYADLPLYKYFVRAESIMQQPFNYKQMDELEIIDTAMKKLEKQRPDLSELICARKIYSYLLVLSRILDSKNKSEYKDQRDRIKKEVAHCGRKILLNPNVKISWKIKILSLVFGESCFYKVDKIMSHLIQKRQS